MKQSRARHELDPLDGYAEKLNDALYGPKFCKHCNQVQPVRTFKLQGSDYSEVKGTTLTVGFEGAQACDVCLRPIESPVKTAKGEK